MKRNAQRDLARNFACIAIILAAGLRGLYLYIFEKTQIPSMPHWGVQWCLGYVIFVWAYLLATRAGLSPRRLIVLATAQSLSTIWLVWLYPDFTVTCLLVVVAWQVGWFLTFRAALTIAIGQAVALAAIKCAGETNGTALLILAYACGLNIFAVFAAHLASREAQSHDRLVQVNAELHAAQTYIAENARIAERSRIFRDLHDTLGHGLTTLAVQLDIAQRVTPDTATVHVRSARETARALLEQVRTVVGKARVEPIDLKRALEAMAENVGDLRVSLTLPDELAALDAARAETLLRCVQEVITNTLRHAHASELLIELKQTEDGEVSIAVRDDGKGGPFVPGNGLVGMRERFERLGGSLLATGEDGGFRLYGALPPVGARQ